MDNTKRLLSFLDESPTAFHAAANIIATLEKAGYVCLRECDSWQLKPGGKYLVQRNQSSLIAFQLPAKPEATMPARMVASHLDSPALRLKLRGYKQKCGLQMVPTEVYGGAIACTWLDRPLGIAGRVVNCSDDGVKSCLYNKTNAAIVPNLALLHLGADMKNGVNYNPQTQLAACIGTTTEASLEAVLGIPKTAFDDSELNLYDCNPAQLLGEKKDILNAPRLDNMLAAFTALDAMLAMPSRKTELALAFFADNEEIGSSTRQGANSNFLSCVLHRIVLALGGGEEELQRMLASSFLISNDAAHAWHPSYMEAYEADYAPSMGQGLVLKKNVRQRYASNGSDIAFFRRLCLKAGIDIQDFTNRADKPCGSTVGPALTTQLGIRGLDIGVAMLAMHSIRETAALSDVWSCRDAVLQFLGNSEPMTFADTLH